MRTARMMFEISDYEAADPETRIGEFGAEIKFSELTSDSTHHYRQLEHFDKLVEKIRARLVAALGAA